uniref:BAH domain-containing protein n=1 Tax=Kalanchoe fedtschenkoi TaxID=63787 RepID=A0A7N0UMD8_KALFE
MTIRNLIFTLLNVLLVGDNILLKAPKGKKPYVAKVIEITADDKQGKNNVQIEGRWYYRPEDAKGGRRNFHGKNELFLSNHVDTQLPESIEGKCNVCTFEEYLKLDVVENTDYFYRLQYDPNTQQFNPNRLEVYGTLNFQHNPFFYHYILLTVRRTCVCELPVNPDLMLVKCDICSGRFHPECVDISRKEAQSLETFICITCKPPDANIQGQTSSSEKEHVSMSPQTNSSSSPSKMPASSSLHKIVPGPK